jgi:indolepyruvate ferredoxin oxidoreductase, alpha subunit
MTVTVERSEAAAATDGRVLLSGNEAIARGAYEARVRVAAGYPGTPSTEILESLVRQDPSREVYVEWSSNEKVALDIALGASLGGSRALVTMKHVGLNVAADTLMTASYTGVRGGLVVVSADDPGMHSSQNEQDNRIFARFAQVPLLEPSDSDECRAFAASAFDLSERFDVPVLLRTTTRIAHTRGVVRPGERTAPTDARFERDPAKLVMLPSNARARHRAVLARSEALARYTEECPLNRLEIRGRSVGVITSGIAYHYVREVLPDASTLRIGLSYPVPVGLARALAEAVERVIVVEELEPFLEDQLRAAGLAVEGKRAVPREGELSVEVVRDALARLGALPAAASRHTPVGLPVAARPPVLCPGCPHVAPFLALREMGAVVMGDIGCYTLAAMPPLSAMDSCVAMGSSIGMAIGVARSGGAGAPVVAAIGDSTFIHAGLPALADAVYNGTRLVVLVLDNGTTAMTGGQPHPAAGATIRGDAAGAVDLPALCRALGADVTVVDPYDLAATTQALRRAVEAPGVSVVITDRPCVEEPVKIRDRPYWVIADRCIACQACLNLGCPSILWSSERYEGRPKVEIDPQTCTGCTLCAQVCPAEAMVPVEAWP